MARHFTIALYLALVILLGNKRCVPGVDGFATRTRQPPSSLSWNRPFQQSSMNHFAATTTTHRIAISHSAVPSGSSLELIEPETGCQVVLVGCFHGSKSSAMDVSTSLLLEPDNDNNSEKETTTTTTHVVVLELCASRFADMRRDMERTEKQSTQRPWLMRYGTMISKTVQSRGLSTGLAAALLGGVSGMQTSLSGLEPGLEFRTAVQHVQEHGGDDDNACDIILADQNVDETLDKVGNLFAISVQMWQTYWQHGWEASFGREAAALGRAVLGNANEESLNLWDFCTRNTESIRDMVRLLVPPVVMLQVIVVTINQGMAWLATQSTGNTEVLLDVLNADTASMTLSDSLSVLAINSSILTAGYLFMALPAVRVILRERDDTLTQGIRQACRVAAAKAGDSQRGRVVAVLGLLHVNGIAERLRGNVNDEAAKERK